MMFLPYLTLRVKLASIPIRVPVLRMEDPSHSLYSEY